MSKTFSGKQVVKALNKIGYTYLYTKGSHAVLYNDMLRIKLVVPLHKELKRGMLSSILKRAGLTIENLNKLV